MAEQLVKGWSDTSATSAALAAFGLKADEPLERQALLVWPENWMPLEVFGRMTTQLITGGMGGVIGLRYEALPLVMRICGVSKKCEAEVLDAVRVMERRMVELLNQGK